MSSVPNTEDLARTAGYLEITNGVISRGDVFCGGLFLNWICGSEHNQAEERSDQEPVVASQEMILDCLNRSVSSTSIYL